MLPNSKIVPKFLSALDYAYLQNAFEEIIKLNLNFKEPWYCLKSQLPN